MYDTFLFKACVLQAFFCVLARDGSRKGRKESVLRGYAKGAKRVWFLGWSEAWGASAKSMRSNFVTAYFSVLRL